MEPKDEDIKELWQFVAKNAIKMNWIDLQWEDKSNNTDVSESKLIYKRIVELFEKISPDLSFALKTGFIFITDNDIAQKLLEKCPDTYITTVQTRQKIPMLHRYEIIISANGNLNNFPLVEKIYNLSKEYLIGDEILDDIAIIKYLPKSRTYYPGVMFQTVSISPSIIKYRLQRDNELLDIIFVIDDDFIRDNIKKQEDIDSLRNSFYFHLEMTIGEFATATYIPRITVLPEFGYKLISLEGNLKPFENLHEELLVLHQFKKCSWCQLEENNVHLKNKDDKLYCPYCFGCLCRLEL